MAPIADNDIELLFYVGLSNRPEFVDGFLGGDVQDKVFPLDVSDSFNPSRRPFIEGISELPSMRTPARYTFCCCASA